MLCESLSGIRILDFTQLAAGPMCTMMLADMGADVIKVESPQGDLARKLGPPWANGESVTFLAMNRNKRSVGIDLKKPEGVELVLRLVRDADVIVESFRPGVMERLGLGYERLRQDRPGLVYCAISAYGQDGPWRDKPGVDGVLQAVSGLMSISGDEGSAPSKALTPTVDMVTGFLALAAISAALHQRDRTGTGQKLDINMYASAIMLQQTSIATYLHTGEVPLRCGSAAPYAAPNEAFQASDGYMMIAAYQADRWTKLCAAVGLPELAEDSRFIDNASRVSNRGELVQMLNTELRHHTREHWMDLFEREDIICAAICDYSEVIASPQMVFGKMLVGMDHPVAGHVEVPGFVLGGPASPVCVRLRPPMHGEHTETILNELGLAPKQIATLLEQGVVFSCN